MSNRQLDISSLCECERWRDGTTICPVHGTVKDTAPITDVEQYERDKYMTLNTISENGATVERLAIEGDANAAYAMSREEFAAKSVKERDVVLFTLLCDMAAEVKELRFKVADYEEKAKGMMTPEGIQEFAGKLMGGIGGGMFGGLLG